MHTIRFKLSNLRGVRTMVLGRPGSRNCTCVAGCGLATPPPPLETYCVWNYRLIIIVCVAEPGGGGGGGVCVEPSSLAKLR